MGKNTEKAVEMAKALFGDNVNVKVVEVTPQTEETKEDTKEETGTLIQNSLISDEEKATIAELVKVFDKLMNVRGDHNNLVRVLGMEKSDYVMLQYLMYLDHIHDAMEAIKGLNYVAHEMTKEHVDKVAKENNLSLTEMTIRGMMGVLSNIAD